MIGQFLAGLIVGVLLGLAIAPLLRAWILWQTAAAWRDEDHASDRRRATRARSDA